MKLLVLIVLVLLIHSCSTKIDLEIPNTEPKIVVNSLITNDSVITVYLTKTIQVLSNETNIVEKATVKLYADNEFVENLSKINDSTFQSISLAKENIEYKLEIEVEGFEPISAKTTIPTNCEIFLGTYLRDGYFDNPFFETLVEIGLIDNQTQTDYYLVSFYGLSYKLTGWDTLNNVPIVLDSTIRSYSDFGYLNSNDPVILNEGDLQFLEPMMLYYLVFSDELLNYSNNLKFIIGTGATLDVFVLMRNINYDLYKYYKSLFRQNYNSGMISVDLTNMFLSNNPNDLYTNVENGLGIFAGFSETHFKLTEIK